jgi:hypothetical protein
LKTVKKVVKKGQLGVKKGQKLIKKGQLGVNSGQSGVKRAKKGVKIAKNREIQRTRVKKVVNLGLKSPKTGVPYAAIEKLLWQKLGFFSIFSGR